MINPEGIHQQYEYVDEIPEVIRLGELPPYDRYDYDLSDEKSFDTYIKDIEAIIRGSHEYRKMVKYLRENLDMNKCSFYENVSNVDSTKIRIEIHHAPFGLHDIVMIVYNKRVAFRESLEVELVAEEAMWLHYKTWVGLIPLSETVHELVHNQYIFVPCTKVYGKWLEFANRYEPYMAPEMKETLNAIIEASKYAEENSKTILSKKYIYIDVSGAYDLPKMEDVAHMLKQRIADLMDDPPVPVEKPKEMIDPMIFNIDV